NALRRQEDGSRDRQLRYLRTILLFFEIPLQFRHRPYQLGGVNGSGLPGDEQVVPLTNDLAGLRDIHLVSRRIATVTCREQGRAVLPNWHPKGAEKGTGTCAGDVGSQDA